MKILKFFSLNRSEIVLLSIVFLAAIIFRVAYIWDYNIHFYFDQSRDAYQSLQIYQKGDFKIQGPSASGTNDTVYHGVLYYYLIGFFYFLSSGNPVVPNIAIIVVAASSMLPVFLLAKKIFKSNLVGWLSVLLLTASSDQIMFSVALANTTLLIPLLAWFYYLLWTIFIEKNYKYLPFLALIFGLCNQSAVFSLYLVSNILGIYGWFSYKRRRLLLGTFRHYLLSVFIYLLTISTMLLTQYKLWKAGIFDPFNTLTSVQSSRPLDTVILDSLSFLSKKLEFILFPTNPEISLLVASILLIIGLALLFSNKKNGLLYLWFLSPLLLVALTAKSSYHISVGVSAGFYILLASMLAKISHKTWGRVATIMFLAIYLYSNLTYLLVIKNQRGDKLSVQSGGMLGDQLDLIEKTYTDNPDRSFSIATLTGPHGMNTTWSYLYQWYGVEKYGYVPTWFGADQKGIPAGEYLTNVSHPENTHYVIYEPNPGSSPDTREEFREIQTIYAGDPLETVIFDKLVLEKRSSVDAK